MLYTTDHLMREVQRWRGYDFTNEEILTCLRNPVAPEYRHLKLYKHWSQAQIDEVIASIDPPKEVVKEEPSFADAFMKVIEDRRNDPDTPRCAMSHCKKPSMVMREFDIPTDGKRPSERGNRDPIPTQKMWLLLCEDCEDGLLWSSNGYIPKIKEICEGKDLRS